MVKIYAVMKTEKTKQSEDFLISGTACFILHCAITKMFKNLKVVPFQTTFYDSADYPVGHLASSLEHFTHATKL